MKFLSKSLRLPILIAAFFLASSVLTPFTSFATTGVTVTFVVYDGQVSPQLATQIATSNGTLNLTPMATLFPGLNYPDHVFAFWSTEPGGGGSTYSDGGLYPFLNGGPLYAQWIGPSHTVTFAENINATDLIASAQVGNSPTSLTPFANLSVTFSNPNHTFAGWNTSPDGSGANYADGAVYNFSSAIVLYAQWIQDTHGVSFYANRSAGDASVQSQTGNSPMSLTSVSELGILDPNHSFAGWSTQADGSGDSFTDEATYSFVADLSVYAQWTLDQETISFSSNTGDGSVSSLSVPYGSQVTIPNGSSLAKTNYSFAGWNTMPDGSGTQYNPGSELSVQSGATLYAAWTRNTYVVTFAIPGLHGEVAPIAVLAGDSILLRASSMLVNPGFTFAGWYTSPVGGQLAGTGDGTYQPTSSLTLYANWTSNPDVILEFSDNGGTGHIRALTAHRGLAVVIPNGSALRRSGYTFRGWASSSRATVPSVTIGTRFVLTHPKILYAMWRHVLPASTPQVLLGSVGMFAPNASTLTSAMRRYISSIAVGINQRDRTQIVLYGYATSTDSAHGSALLSLQRALAVQKELKLDLAGLNDVGVVVHASGEGRLSNSVLASFRDVEVFAN